MSNPGRPARRRSAAAVAALALAAAAGLSGCGGGGGADGAKKTGDAKPTTTAGVTLTPSGEKLALGEAATLKWSPNQNVTGLAKVAVTSIVQGSDKDVAKVQINPRPEGMRLYYVRIHLSNVGKTDLGGVSPNTLPLHLDEGTDLLQQPATIDPKLKFDLCPSVVLPAKFVNGAAADACLVYVATSPIKQLLLQPEEGDQISWPGTVTTPTPKPSAKPTGKSSGKPTGTASKKPAPTKSAG